MKTDTNTFIFNIEIIFSNDRGSRYLHLKKVYFLTVTAQLSPNWKCNQLTHLGIKYEYAHMLKKDDIFRQSRLNLYDITHVPKKR